MKANTNSRVSSKAGVALMCGAGLLLCSWAALPETYHVDPKAKLLGWLGGGSTSSWTRLDGPSQDMVMQALDSAHRAMQHEQPRDAIDTLTRAMKFVISRAGPDDGAMAHLYARRSFALFTLRDTDGERALQAAIDDSGHARELIARWFPGDPDWLGLETGQLGLYLSESNRIPDAVAAFQQALKSLPPASRGIARVRRLRVLLWYADTACNNNLLLLCNSALAQARPLAESRETHPDDRLDFDSMASSTAFLQGRLGEGFASGQRLLAVIGSRAEGPSPRDLVLLQRYLWMSELVGARDEVRKSIGLVERVENLSSARGRELGPESAVLLPSVLGTAADAAMWLSDAARAEDLANRALAWMKRRGQPPWHDLAAVLSVKGRAAEARGDYPLALQHARASIGMGGACAIAFGRMARIEAHLGDEAAMMNAIESGLDRMAQAGDCRSSDWEFFAESARALASHDRLPLAVVFAEEAVERNELQRAVLVANAPERGSDFIASRADIYFELAAWLSELGRDGDAADVLSALHGLEADEYLRGAPAATPAAKVWISDDDRRARALLSSGKPGSRTTAAADALGQGRRNEPAKMPEAFVPAVNAGDTVVNAWYHSGGLELQVWDMSGLIAHRSVAISREKLGALIDRFDTSLRARTPLNDPDSAARWSRELGEVLWKPIAGDIAKQTSPNGVVHLSLSGLLRRVPFPALDDGGKYLGERYAFEVIGEPPASGAVAKPQLASFGARAAPAGFAPLPNAGKEADAAVGLAGGRSKGNRSFIDTQFTRASFAQALGGGEFSRVHLASHFIVPRGDAASAYLVLGDGSGLAVEDLAKLPMKGVSLAVLSACSSAAPIGGRGATGGELSSLSTVFQRQGTRAVVASLWGVDDRSVMNFMQAFYRELWSTPGATPARALLAARRAMLAGSAEYRHPYFWAAFIAQGA